MTSVSRRRSRRDEETEPDEETPRRRRRSRDEDDEPEERPRRSRRSRDEDDEPDEKPRRSRRSRDEDEDDDKPRRRRSSRSRDDEDEDDKPRRRRSRDEDEERPKRRQGNKGFGAYRSMKRSGGSFATDFKPESGKKVLIKILDDGPFDVYNQHFFRELPQGERKSFVCLKDPDYFGKDAEDGCPLCDIGDNPRTYSLFNIVDLSNPRKPEVKVWSTSPTVTDILDRAAEEKKTSPLNRDDLYFEVEMVKGKNKTTWHIESVKARDLPEDYDMDPLEDEEIADFEEQRHTDRTAVTKVDDYDALDDLAESLSD